MLALAVSGTIDPAAYGVDVGSSAVDACITAPSRVLLSAATLKSGYGTTGVASAHVLDGRGPFEEARIAAASVNHSGVRGIDAVLTEF